MPGQPNCSKPSLPRALTIYLVSATLGYYETGKGPIELMTIDTELKFAKMTEIGAIVANCLAFVKSRTRPGMTTKHLDEMAARFLEEHGAISAPIAMYKFPGSVCISVEKEAAHGIPSDRVLKEGDLINVDVSASKNGLYADNGESYVVGGPKANEHKAKMCEQVKEALFIGLDVISAGARVNRVGKAVEQFAKNHDLTVIRNLGGHGIGESLHEKPSFIGSFYDRRDKRFFKENMTLAIEPFLSNGGKYVEEANDGWTLFHKDCYSVQKEHTIMVTKGKPHIFTHPTMDFPEP